MPRRKLITRARRAPIIRRLDTALDRMAERGMEPRVIYLTWDDWDAYDAAQSKAYGARLCVFHYSDIPIRSGERSRIFSMHGVGVDVPRRA
jgi:hypothetical protein